MGGHFFFWPGPFHPTSSIFCPKVWILLPLLDALDCLPSVRGFLKQSHGSQWVLWCLGLFGGELSVKQILLLGYKKSNAETVNMEETYLVGGFNPFEKYESKWVHLPNFRGENKQIFMFVHNLTVGSYIWCILNHQHLWIQVGAHAWKKKQVKFRSCRWNWCDPDYFFGGGEVKWWNSMMIRLNHLKLGSTYIQLNTSSFLSNSFY